MVTITIDGKDIEISMESFKALKKSLTANEMEIPQTIVEHCVGKAYLSSPTGKSYMHIDCSNNFCVESGGTNHNYPSAKLVDCDLKDLKVGDVFRWSHTNDFKDANKDTNLNLRLITRIEKDKIIYQYWTDRGNVLNSNINFKYNDYYYQVARKI